MKLHVLVTSINSKLQQSFKVSRIACRLSFYGSFPKCVPRKICRCVTNLLKVVYIDTNFVPKLKKCYVEVMVDDLHKLRVAFQVSAREAMTLFFLEITNISVYATRFLEIVARRGGNLQKQKKIIAILADSCFVTRYRQK